MKNLEYGLLLKDLTFSGDQASTPYKYDNEVIFPDKVRLNLYYLHHYSFPKDIQMIFATILGKRIQYADEII